MSEPNIKVSLSLAQRKVICQIMPVLYLRLLLITPSQRVVSFAPRELEAIRERATELDCYVGHGIKQGPLNRVIAKVTEAIEKSKEIDSRPV
jgi:hypothetical protein